MLKKNNNNKDNKFLKEAIRKNFSQCLNEFIEEDSMEEGFSDFAKNVKNFGNKISNGIKKGINNFAEKNGIVNKELDDYIAKNNVKNLGAPHGKRSFLSTLANLGTSVAKTGAQIMGGDVSHIPGWKEREKNGNGLTSTKKPNYEEEYNAIKTQAEKAVRSMISYMTLANILSTQAQPTLFGIVTRGNQSFFQMVNPNNLDNTGGNLSGNLITPRNLNAIMQHTQREVSKIKSVGGETKHFVKNQNFEHFKEMFNDILETTQINYQGIDSAITQLGQKLDAIDMQINAYLLNKGGSINTAQPNKYSTLLNYGLTNFKQDPKFMALINTKVNLVNSEIEKVAQMARNHYWHVLLPNRQNIFTWFFDMNQLQGMIEMTPKLTADRFLNVPKNRRKQ